MEMEDPNLWQSLGGHTMEKEMEMEMEDPNLWLR